MVYQPLRRELNPTEYTSDFEFDVLNGSQQYEINSYGIDNDIGKNSASIMIYFNNLETSIEAAAENNEYKFYTQAVAGDSSVPMKNQAWASTRNLTDIVPNTADAPAPEGVTEFLEKFDKSLRKAYYRTTKAIHLLAPESIQYSSGAGWEDVNFELNALGLIADAAMQEDTGSALKRAGSTMGREAADLLNKLGDGGDIASALTKSTINPYTQQAFKGMGRRTFQFNWVFAPKNDKELYEIDRIIFGFRYHMHPTISDLAGNTGENYLNFPSQVDLEWYFRDAASSDWVENAWLPKISTCVIESVTTDYTPNGRFSFFKGAGAPTQINFSIQLKEVHSLMRKDIGRGF